MHEPDQNAESGLPREAALFQAAGQLTGPDCAAFLDRACGSDVALRRRLVALLVAHEQSEGVLAEPEPAAKATMKLELANTPDESIGQVIGRYKGLQKVGEGGCGVVYVAEQTEPVRRRVALKVIKLGMDTRWVGAIDVTGTLNLWRAPSWAEIHAAEAKNPPSPGYGATGKTEGQPW